MHGKKSEDRKKQRAGHYRAAQEGRAQGGLDQQIELLTLPKAKKFLRQYQVPGASNIRAPNF